MKILSDGDYNKETLPSCSTGPPQVLVPLPLSLSSWAQSQGTGVAEGRAGGFSPIQVDPKGPWTKPGKSIPKSSLGIKRGRLRRDPPGTPARGGGRRGGRAGEKVPPPPLGCRRPESGNSDVILMILDLANLNSVQTFAKTFLKSEPHLDILINNAEPPREFPPSGSAAEGDVSHPAWSRS
ncbi:dehydrogenase/reductase SDR family member 13-like [Crotalus adamanteus]|uniref:Dehydrogenase/reductase SDR family member 13-like n=1 Tax=Crotalus adamanteus TaxID=8729 RepID=A0AAW1CH65_CROAD